MKFLSEGRVSILDWRSFFLHSCLLILSSLLPAVAMAEKRLALVIGNSDYEFVSNLPNPANDAQDIAAALTRLGFDVTVGTDLDFRAMRLMMRDFSDKAQEADKTLIYFAGHGIEIENNNYLIPVNARLKSDRDIKFEAVPLDLVVNSISENAGLKVVLVDACRNNPFLVDMIRTSATRSVGRGLGGIDPGGVLVGYSARGGTLALDGEGRNSPYAEALLKHIEEPGLEIGKLFRKVRDSVFEATAGYQEPFTYGSLPGADIFLKPPVKLAALPAAEPGSAQDQKMIAAYARAEARPTLNKWNRFLEEFGGDEDHHLVILSIKKRDTLQEIEDKKKRLAAAEPWLTPEAGLKGRDLELTRSERRLVQKSLMYLGYDVGEIDGVFGARTKSAIARARAQFGLRVGPNVDALLIKKLPNVIAIDGLLSKTAKIIPAENIEGLNEPRLEKALSGLSSNELVFGYFEGHLYIAVKLGTYSDWYRNNSNAKRVGGHLVTITSPAENRFVYELFAGDEGFFLTDSGGSMHGPGIGLQQFDRSKEPAGGWGWITGEPLSYVGWSPGNPDNFRGSQHFASFYARKDVAHRGGRADKWDDVSTGGIGYIIEVE